MSQKTVTVSVRRLVEFILRSARLEKWMQCSRGA